MELCVWLFKVDVFLNYGSYGKSANYGECYNLVENNGDYQRIKMKIRFFHENDIDSSLF